MNRVDISAMTGRTSKVVRKIIVTLILGGLAYLLTNSTNEPQIWAITLSIFIGGVVLVIQFLVDFENRLEGVELGLGQHSAAIQRILEEKFTKINEATELFSLVESSALRPDAITQLVRHSTQLDPDSPPLLFDFVHAEIGRVSEFLKRTGEGNEVVYDGEDRDWLLALTRGAKATIDAVSLALVDAGASGFDEGGLWMSDLGQRYLDSQREATQRGVEIRRVFVLDRAERADDPDLLRICKLHQEMGIVVRVLDASSLPGTRRTLLLDFILFDSVLSYEVTPASWPEGSGRPLMLSTHLYLRRSHVDERIQRFNDLWAAAREPA